MKFHETDFLRLEDAVRRGLGREPTIAEAYSAQDLARRALAGERQALLVVLIAIRGGAAVSFADDGMALLTVRAEVLDELLGLVATEAPRWLAN